MIKLANVLDDFRISTTGMKVSYDDEGHAEIECCAQMYTENTSLVSMSFSNVAEIKCCSVNFYEEFYNQYYLDYPNVDEKVYSGFYQIVESQYLKNVNNIYDPKNRLKLNHYIVAGNDGYSEIIASNFNIIVISSAD